MSTIYIRYTCTTLPRESDTLVTLTLQDGIVVNQEVTHQGAFAWDDFGGLDEQGISALLYEDDEDPPGEHTQASNDGVTWRTNL